MPAAPGNPSHDPHDHDVDDGEQIAESEEEAPVGEAEASRKGGPRRRRWPWVLLAGVAGVVGTAAIVSFSAPVVKDGSAITLPAPPARSPSLLPAAGTSAPSAPVAPSTIAPGNVQQATLSRDASTLAYTTRAKAVRDEEKAERDKREAEIKAARSKATQAATERDEARPGVNRARPWFNEHPEFTIPSHTPISCTPDNPISSDSIGPLTCTVDKPVRSEDGTNMLLWPGAVMEGYLGQGLQFGQRRLMVTFERIRGTDFSRIPLRGVGASQLGENGIDGTYDSRLWEKIEAGLWLTVIEGGVSAAVGAAQAAAQPSGGGNQFLNFGSISSRTQSTLGQTALAQDYRLPGRTRRDHSDTIIVKTVGDIDLSELYELRSTHEAVADAGMQPVRRRAH